MNEQMSGLERVRQMTNPGMAPLVCDKCGSEWFYEVNLKKYAASTYSSAGGGGDLAMISTTEQAIRVCVCGRAIPPHISGGRRGVGPDEMRSVVTAVDKARTMHDESEKRLNVLSHEALTATQLAEAMQEIASLVTRLAAVEEVIHAAKSKQNPAKEKPSAESKQ